MNRAESEAFLSLIHGTILYLRHDLLGDLKFILHRYVGPILLSSLALQGAISLLREVYKVFFPPDAIELHRYVRPCLWCCVCF
jgi:hypothetical protein